MVSSPNLKTDFSLIKLSFNVSTVQIKKLDWQVTFGDVGSQSSFLTSTNLNATWTMGTVSTVLSSVECVSIGLVLRVLEKLPVY